jgi:glycosyltransferase involved in cell wall biosynthesis
MSSKDFIFRVASDSDCEKEHGRIRFGRDRMLYDFGLKRADVVAAQTEFQAQLLRENHALECPVINMMVEPPLRSANPPDKDIDVLWVSNLRALKRPELALELARQLPDVKFTLAGGPMPGGQTYFDDVAAAAARLPNVTMLGAVKYSETGALFDRARVFLNTSSIEGFPNTFLQSWIRGVPVVSFFDPDGMVHRLQLGRIATSLDDMREALRGLIDVHVYRELIGRRARDFASREYTTGVAARYLELLDSRRQRLPLSAPDGGTV